MTPKAAGRTVRIEARAVVPHFNGEVRLRLFDTHPDVRRAGVLGDVRQRLPEASAQRTANLV